MHLIKLTIKAVPKLRPKFIDKMFDFYLVNQSDTFMLRHMLFKDLFHNASASVLWAQLYDKIYLYLIQIS